MFVTIVYIISVIAWGLASVDLTRLFFVNKKNGESNPSLLIPLLIASISIFLESAYFGIGSILYYAGNKAFFDNVIMAQNNWFIVKFMIAFAGIMFLYELRRKK